MNSQTCKSFYVTPGLEPLYDTPAQICGSAQLIPHAKFQGSGIAILNFHLDGFDLDTGDLGVRMQYLRALESQRTQGDCRGGYKTILTETELYYSPAEEDIRLRHIFPSSAGILQPD